MSWKYYLEKNFLAFANFKNKNNLPVLEFEVQTFLANFYIIDAYIVSSQYLNKELLGTFVKLNFGYVNNSYLKTYKGILAKYSLVGFSGLNLTNQMKLQSLKQENQYIYKITLYPSLWKLNFEKKFRIFQNITKKSVIKQILNEKKINATINFIDDGIKLDSITQYNETTYDFLIRLIEEENLIMYFDDLDNSLNEPALILSQDLLTLNQLSLNFKNSVVGNHDFEEMIHASLMHESVRSTNNLFSYNFENPNMQLSGTISKNTWMNVQDNEFSFVPLTLEEINLNLNNKMNEQANESLIFEAETTSYKAQAGKILILTNSENEELNKKYLIQKTCAKLTSFNDKSWIFRNYIQAIPLPLKFLAKKTKEKPKALGNQSAIVIGSQENKNLNIDKIGRIQVQFLWNGSNQNNDSYSAYIRVMQWGSAGPDFGNYNYPRPGQEVIIGFINSDPDLPVVLGSIYNGQNNYPGANYGNANDPLKDSISKAGVNVMMHHKSFGINGTNSSRFNEISLINKEFDEKINIISQNNINITANNDLNESILNNRNTKIQTDDNFQISGSRYERFGSKHTMPGDVKTGTLIASNMMNDSIDMQTIDKGIKMTHIEAGMLVVVVDAGDVGYMLEKGTFSIISKAFSMLTYEGSKMIIEGSSFVRIAGDSSTTVVGDNSLSVDGEYNLSVAGIYKTSVEGEASFSAVGPLNLSGASVSLSAEGEMSIESLGVLSIKASAISIEAGEISMNGASISLSADAAFEITAGAAVNIVGAIIQLGG